jgi:anaerobic selenocysteine-containing dehydrogenase
MICRGQSTGFGMQGDRRAEHRLGLAADHYEPVSWERAFEIIARSSTASPHPMKPPSGRVRTFANERSPVLVYQLFSA